MSLYNKIRSKLYPIENGFPDFIPQFRLEGRSRDPNNETGLEMRVADPLWMLGRQWQFGEFQGEDNGSPINIRLNYRKEKTAYFTTPDHPQYRQLGSAPLEAKVEAIPVAPDDLRSKVRIGQKFEELINSHFSKSKARNYIRQLRREFPLTVERRLDGKSRRFFNLMAGNVLDGGSLWEQIQVNNFPYGRFQSLKEITDKLRHWYEELFLPASAQKSWQSYQLAHQFSLHAEEDIHLHAPDYQSGRLDWFSFDHAEIGINPKEKAVQSEAFMPVNVSFAAMPDKRLFSFEDSKLDLSGMNLEDSDLLRLMILDFSLTAGSDWYTIPIEMQPGELCWVNEVLVKDVFGVSTTIRNDRDTGLFLDANPLKVWDAFKIRPSEQLRKRVVEEQDLYQQKEHFLYLAPSVAARQESAPLEELLFLRDEYANMVWAIEKTVRNELGKAVNGYDLHLELNGPFLKPEENESPVNSLPRFRLASPVPTNWIPYLPAHIAGSDTDIELRRAVMMRNEASLKPEDVLPISQLARQDLLNIREEAIPRAGVRVQLTRQRVRWTDGETYIWLGRKVLAGKGEGSSGLTFDQLLRR